MRDWKVKGPRTVGWCAKFLSKRGGPVAHHEWWRNTTKLSMTDFGVSEHESIMRSLQDAVEYDQLDIVNLSSFEHMLRRAQLIEYYHREKVRQDTLGKDRPIVDQEEQMIFTGLHVTDGPVMICPALTEYVGKELE
eukprot:1606546-Karenia_brevis.AAC.1